MTRAQLSPEIGARRTAGTEAVPTGAWALDPRSAEGVAESNATLHQEEDRIDPAHASSLLNDFLVLIGRIQADYHRLSNTVHASPTVRGDGRTGRSLHV